MITITEHKYGFTVEGHADYADKGQDIICAGVSTLAQSVARVLEEYYSAHVTIKDGFIDVKYTSLHMNALDVERVFWMGVTEIANQYPKYVQIRRMK